MILIPGEAQNGAVVDSEAAACDFVSEILSGSELLDWSYVHPSLPREVEISSPYEEGMWF